MATTTGYIDFTEQATPASPSAGHQRVFVDSTAHSAKIVNSSGSVSALGGGGTSGGYIWLQRQTAAASAQLDLTTVITSTYETYKVEGTFAPATNAVNLLLRVGTGAGPTIDTGGNYYGIIQTPTGTSTGAAKSNRDAGATSSMLAKTVSNAAVTYGHVGVSLTFRNLSTTTFMKQIDGTVTWHDGTEFFTNQFGGAYAATTAVTAIRFFFSSGNITSGQVDIYGLAKS